MDEINTYCVYKHTSPSGKVYIGITSQPCEERWANGLGYRKNEYFMRAIRKYGWENFTHEILYIGLTEEEACAKEIELISFYDSTNKDKGYNISTGGKYIHSGALHSEESKKKMSEIKKGKKASEETRRKLSKALMGHPVSEETRIKIGQGHIGIHPSEETLKKLSDSHKGIPIKEETKIKLSEGSPKKKEVVQIDPNDNSIVAIFCSMVEAEKVTGISYTSISKCCNNKLKLAGGFQWKYKKDYEQEP